jgi:hypothetical protein
MPRSLDTALRAANSNQTTVERTSRKHWNLTLAALSNKTISRLVLIRSFQVATRHCGAALDDAQDMPFLLKQPDKQKSSS